MCCYLSFGNDFDSNGLTFKIASSNSSKASMAKMATPNFMTKLILGSEILGVPKLLVKWFFRFNRFRNDTTNTLSSGTPHSFPGLFTMPLHKRGLDVFGRWWWWKGPLEKPQRSRRSGRRWARIPRKRTACPMPRRWMAECCSFCSHGGCTTRTTTTTTRVKAAVTTPIAATVVAMLLCIAVAAGGVMVVMAVVALYRLCRSFLTLVCVFFFSWYSLSIALPHCITTTSPLPSPPTTAIDLCSSSSSCVHLCASSSSKAWYLLLLLVDVSMWAGCHSFLGEKDLGCCCAHFYFMCCCCCIPIVVAPPTTTWFFSSPPGIVLPLGTAPRCKEEEEIWVQWYKCCWNSSENAAASLLTTHFTTTTLLSFLPFACAAANLVQRRLHRNDQLLLHTGKNKKKKKGFQIFWAFRRLFALSTTEE